MFEATGHIIIIKDVSCLTCENCGEIYLETKTIQRLEQILEKRTGELEILSFIAA